MLVDTARYRAITGDETTADAVVSARLAEATEMLAGRLDRPLEHGEYTEQLWPTRGGWLWPRATPIESAGDYEVDGAGLRPRWTLQGGPYLVTYVGGWTAETVPACIARDLALAAFELGHQPADASGIDTTGATSVRVGDVAVGWGGAGKPSDAAAARAERCWSIATLRHRYRVVGAI